MDDIQVVDRASEWSKLIRRAYKDECLKINGEYPKNRTLYIDLNMVPQSLFMHLIDHPADATADCKGGLNQSGTISKWTGNPDSINIRFYNHPLKYTVRDLNSSRVGKLVCFEGVVRRIQSTKPAITVASFRCPCGRITRIPQRSPRELDLPTELCSCGRKAISQRLVPEQCEMKDTQVILVQDPHDKVVGSEVPSTVFVRLSDDLCRSVNAGNRVIITGILSVYQKKREDPILETEFDASSVEVLDREFTDIEITAKDEEEILAASESPDIWENLVSSVAPSIYGNDEVKEGIALHLFGGVSRYGRDGTWDRGDIHVLLIGDPGIAKSKILDAVFRLCPRAIITSGKGSSTAGLTAAAVPDGSGGWTLDAGAMPLADRGHLLVDELDKMNADDRSALHRGMEQQEIPINKAGVNTTLKSRCALLCAANPVSGRFDDYQDLASQFNLPSTLLSRFDLIFVCRDTVNENSDRELADFLLSSDRENTCCFFDSEFVRKYICYAQRNFNPELSDGAKTEIAKFYVKLRSMGGDDKPMPITPRQLEGLRRLAQASARTRLSNVIEVSDAMRAIRIMKTCLLHVAYDPGTSTFDIDRVCSPLSKAKRDIMVDLKATIIELGKGNAVQAKLILDEMVSKGHIRSTVENLLEKGYENGAFTSPRRGMYKVM